MRHQYEGHAQRYRQKPQNLADKFVNLIQRAHPFGVHRGRFDHRQPDQIAVQRLYLRRSRRRVGVTINTSGSGLLSSMDIRF